jgi:hypothetical protein
MLKSVKIQKEIKDKGRVMPPLLALLFLVIQIGIETTVLVVARDKAPDFNATIRCFVPDIDKMVL